MKKALIVTTVSGFVPQFEMNNVRILQSMGYEVHYAANYKTPIYTNNNSRLHNSGIIPHQIDFVRSPYRIFANGKAFQQLKRLMQDEHFNLLHCHTPMGGVIGRLAAKMTDAIPVLYTAHGFHFYKGAPLLNWLLFYPMERWLAHATDFLITINKEDYTRGLTFHLRKNGGVYLVPGVGIPITQANIPIANKCRLLERKKYNIPPEAFVVLSVGELNQNKNHEILIRAIATLEQSNIYYIICGNGSKRKDLEYLAKQLGLPDRVKLLGYQKDIQKFLQMSDVFAISSFREGLSVSLMEAMSAGLPVIASKIRGNVDLIKDGLGGYLVEQNKLTLYADALRKIMNANKTEMGNYNRKCIDRCSNEKVTAAMHKIYARASHFTHKDT